MTLNSTFASRGLGLMSYSNIGPVTAASISAFYFGGQQVYLGWTPPVATPLASVEVEWFVNGAYTGTVLSYDPAVTSITTAASPLLGTSWNPVGARIRCKGVSGVYSPYTIVTAVTIPTERATSVVVVYGGTAGTASVTWTKPYGATSSIVQRTVGAATTVVNVGASASYVDSPGSGGLQAYYTITSVNSGGSTDIFPAIGYITDPNAPTAASTSATNTGILSFTSTAPTHANIASYDLQLETYTGASWVLTGASITGAANPAYTWGAGTATHNSAYRGKVRTVGTTGLISAWATSASVAGVNDTTGPVVGAISVSAWNQTVGGFVITRPTVTDAGSSVASVVLEVSYDAGASIYETVTATAASGTTNHTIATAKRGLMVSYRLKATDSLSNVTTTSWTTVQTKPYGTFYVVAVQSSTWETAGAPSWRTDTDDVISGRLDTTYETQSGYWFYGTGVSTTCKGYQPDSGTVLMQRQGTSGFSGTVSVGYHGSTTRPTSAPTVLSVETGPNFGGVANQILYHTLSATHLAALQSGAAAGFASVDPGSYRRLAGITTTGYSGMLTLIFN